MIELMGLGFESGFSQIIRVFMRKCGDQGGLGCCSRSSDKYLQEIGDTSVCN